MGHKTVSDFFRFPVQYVIREDVQNRAYAAAVVLTIIVLVLSFGGRYMMAHFSKNKV